MSQVFVSYASEDRDRARGLARLLEARGFSVFWDRTIPPGRTWDDVIEAALREARVVIVLWSSASVRSDWVKAEAGDAAQRRILVPAVLEPDLELPLRFRAIQAADLTGWDGARATPEIDAMCTAIGVLAGGERHAAWHDAAEQTPPAAAVAGGAATDTPVPRREPPRAARSGAPPNGAGRALARHLLFGTALFFVAPELRRKWLYPCFPVYAALDALLGPGLGVDPFRGSFGGQTFVASLVLYALTFIDVWLVVRRRGRGEPPAHAGAPSRR